MQDLRLSVAVGDYDRMRPLIDGDVQIDGVDPVFLRLSPEEIFFRAFRSEDFDICELSMSSTVLKMARGECPYVPIPVFPSRAFRHTAFYINAASGIRKPEDLRGRRIGVGEYQLTANVWARAILEDDYGIKPSEIEWVRGGIEELGRKEKIHLTLPEGVNLVDAPADRTLASMLAEGEIDALFGPRMPSSLNGDGRVRWLFDDPITAARDWYARTKIFPIMHTLGIRRSLVEQHPWLPATVQKAFEQSKALCLSRLRDTSATKVTLPFIEEGFKGAQELLGDDFWSYGYEANRHVVQSFIDHHYRQGLSPVRLSAEDLFHPATLDVARI